MAQNYHHILFKRACLPKNKKKEKIITDSDSQQIDGGQKIDMKKTNLNSLVFQSFRLMAEYKQCF